MGIGEWIIVIGVISLFILFPIALRNSEKVTQKENFSRINMKHRREYISKFEKVYYELSTKEFLKLEKLRKINKTYYLLITFVLIATLAHYVFLSVFDFDIPFLIAFYGPVIILLIILGPIGYFNDKIKKQYALEYKASVFPKFIEIVNETFLHKYISENDAAIESLYKEVTFSTEDYDYLKADDYIVGEIENSLFRLADIYTYRIVRTNNTPKERPVFKGLFAVMNLENNVSTEVQVRKIKKSFSNNLYLKDYEYHIFENDVDIYSNDKFLIDKLVSSGIIQILNEHYERFGVQFEIILKDSKIYMRFYTGPMFEPPVFGDVLNKEVLYFYYCSLILIEDFNKELKKIVDSISL